MDPPSTLTAPNKPQDIQRTQHHKTSQQSRRIHRNTNTMPTNEAIDNARLRGAIARNAADQQLLNPDQRAQNPADAALSLPLPRENTAAVARIFSAFPGDCQPQAAIQTAPPIDSRTGQHPSISSKQ